MAFRSRCQSLTLDVGIATTAAVADPAVAVVVPGSCGCRPPASTVSMRFMRRLLPCHGQETTRHQFAQHQAELLSLAGCQPFPKLVRVNRSRSSPWRRWRRGGTHGLTLLDMDHLLVTRIGVAGTTVPLATTPTR